MQDREGRWQQSIVTLLILALMVVMAGVMEPGAAQAANFGGLTDNGTARFMGIGTNYNTSRNLHVVGSPLFERAVDTAGFLIKRTAANRWFLGVNENPLIGYGFVISTFPEGAGSSTPRVLVMQDGRVGINTINPGSGYKLHVVNDNTTDRSSAIYGTTSGGQTAGVAGEYTTGHYLGALGGPSWGAYGTNNNGSEGELGTDKYAVYGRCTDNGTGVYGRSDRGYAGYFYGTALVTDNISVGKTSMATSTLDVNGSLATAYSVKFFPGPYTLTRSESIVAVNAVGGAITINLPTAVGITGRSYTIKKVDTVGANTVTIDANGAETIDGALTYSLSAPWKYVTVASNGIGWLIVANN